MSGIVGARARATTGQQSWSLRNLDLVGYFPPGSQDFEVNSETWFHHEIVIRFQNLPKRFRRLLLVKILMRATTGQPSAILLDLSPLPIMA